MQARADANTAVVDAKRERKEVREKEARKVGRCRLTLLNPS